LGGNITDQWCGGHRWSTSSSSQSGAGHASEAACQILSSLTELGEAVRFLGCIVVPADGMALFSSELQAKTSSDASADYPSFLSIASSTPSTSGSTRSRRGRWRACEAGAHPVPWPPRSLRANSVFKRDPPPSVSRNQAVRARARLTVAPPLQEQASLLGYPRRLPGGNPRCPTGERGCTKTRAEQGERLTQGWAQNLGHRLRKWATSGPRAAARARG
jgi:hypothetical protein